MTSASNHTGVDVASQADTHGVGESVATFTVGSTGTGARSTTQDWGYGHGNPAATPSSGDASPSLADATGSRSQRLGNDCVFLIWKRRSWSGQVPRIE